MLCGGVPCRAGVLGGGVTCRVLSSAEGSPVGLGCWECQQEVQLSSASERKTVEKTAGEVLGTWLSQ